MYMHANNNEESFDFFTLVYYLYSNGNFNWRFRVFDYAENGFRI